MEFEVILDKKLENEKVVIYAKENSDIIDEIKNIIEKSDTRIAGYKDSEIKLLEQKDITCVAVDGGRVFAICDDSRFLLKERLYTVEDKLDGNFVKINQSCIANIEKIQMFETSIGATLKVKFKNGYCDYVSRRQLKAVKERLGLKK